MSGPQRTRTKGPLAPLQLMPAKAHGDVDETLALLNHAATAGARADFEAKKAAEKKAANEKRRRAKAEKQAALESDALQLQLGHDQFPMRELVSFELQVELEEAEVKAAKVEYLGNFRHALCPRCRERCELTWTGRIPTHHPAFKRAPGRKDVCSGSGKRPRSKQVLGVEAPYLPEPGDASSSTSSFRASFAARRELLRQCPPMVQTDAGKFVSSHALLDGDAAAYIIADSVKLLPDDARQWLEQELAGVVMTYAQACLSSALRVPIVLAFGCNDEYDRDAKGNGGGRLVDALPFDRRARRDLYPSRFDVGKEKSGTYAGRYVRKLLEDARNDSRAVRAVRLVEEPIKSERGGARGPYASTGKVYARRYKRSLTYLTCDALREVYRHKHLLAWRDAMRRVMAPRKLGGFHAWAWLATEKARRARVGIKYEDQILPKIYREERYRSRAIRRTYSEKTHGEAKSYHSKSRSRVEQKVAPLGGAASAEAGSPVVAATAAGPPTPAVVDERALSGRALAELVPVVGVSFVLDGVTYASRAEFSRALTDAKPRRN